MMVVGMGRYLNGSQINMVGEEGAFSFLDDFYFRLVDALDVEFH